MKTNVLEYPIKPRFTIKVPTKNASGIVVCLIRMLQIFSNIIG